MSRWTRAPVLCIVSAVNIRPATSADLPAILEMNEESVHFLSPLTEKSLTRLHAQAAFHRVIETEEGIAGFLLAFREGADYDSPNYRWFAERYPQFLYIDRIALRPAYRGRRLADRLYDDLIAFAGATGVALIACEFNIDPPNPASRRFHERHGFREVGTQPLFNGTKIVSMQIRQPA